MQDGQRVAVVIPVWHYVEDCLVVVARRWLVGLVITQFRRRPIIQGRNLLDGRAKAGPRVQQGWTKVAVVQRLVFLRGCLKSPDSVKFGDLTAHSSFQTPGLNPMFVL